MKCTIVYNQKSLLNLPASDNICKFLIEHKCCKPKSRTCEHQRKKSAVNDNIVDI